MKLCECLLENCIFFELKARDKWSFFKEVAPALAKTLGKPPEEIQGLLEERERLGTTAIGQEIAIPHCRVPGLEHIAIVVAIQRKGIDFEALDKQAVKIIFIILAPDNESQPYLRVLAYMSRLLKNDHFKKKLLACKTPQEVKKILSEVDYEF